MLRLLDAEDKVRGNKAALLGFIHAQKCAHQWRFSMVQKTNIRPQEFAFVVNYGELVFAKWSGRINFGILPIRIVPATCPRTVAETTRIFISFSFVGLPGMNLTI